MEFPGREFNLHHFREFECSGWRGSDVREVGAGEPCLGNGDRESDLGSGKARSGACGDPGGSEDDLLSFPDRDRGSGVSVDKLNGSERELYDLDEYQSSGGGQQ